MSASFREKRITPRSRVFFGGEILVDSAIPSVECHVKNVSHGGASIFVLCGEFLPDRFDLVIKKTNQRHHAVVTWSRGRELGVAYQPYSSASRKWASPSALRRVLVNSQARS